ncbi:MAG: N-acetylmuramidase family protein [Muribaculaceae bacterium]|nr:N-acetylmuramidase family protein [Muribaculaceae bacterium]
MRLRAALLAVSVLVSAMAFSFGGHEQTHSSEKLFSETPIAEASLLNEQTDTIVTLTEEDFAEVAARLGVEVAAIKAVVEIEAGRTHEGFASPGHPLINFDLTMFRRFAKRRGVNLSKYSKTHSVVFNSHRGNQTRARRRLDAARTIHPHAAIEGTFWGMFQIGGFNWKKCGCSSIEEFEERMSRSERDQLDMFAEFITNAGLLKHLQNKNWAAFARGYNGPSYARRAYHTRMASAYAKHKKLDKDITAE